MGNAPESMVDPDGMQFSAAAKVPDYFSMLYRGMFPTAEMYLPGGALSGKRENPFDSKSWGGLSGSALKNYIGTQNNDLAATLTAHVFESGSFMGNMGTSGGNASSDKPMQEADGTIIVYGKRLGFFGKIWKGIKNAGGDLLKWLKFSDGKGDDIHERNDKTHDKGGGIMFTGADGGYGEGRIADNADKQAVGTDDMEFLFGHGIQGIGSLNETVERVDYFTSLFTQMYDVTSQLNDVMKPITEKNGFLIRPTDNGKGIIIDTVRKDTSGFHKAFERMSDSLFNH